jgi:hypothetical protein
MLTRRRAGGLVIAAMSLQHSPQGRESIML